MNAAKSQASKQLTLERAACFLWNLWNTTETVSSAGPPRSTLMEFLPIMINRAGVLIASEVIRGMLELSCDPVSSHLPPSLIHCSLLLVVLRANEEAVIDPCGQGRLCSALLSA